MDFRSKHPFEARKAEAERICEKFPGRIPVIVERTAKSTIPELDKQKFLVPGDLTIGQFCYVIRKRMALPPEQALFLFVGNSLPTTGSILREMYQLYKNEDGFLYIQISGESTFGFH